MNEQYNDPRYATQHYIAAESVPESYLECRILGHAWKQDDVLEPRTGFFRFILLLSCMRCPVTKEQYFDRNFDQAAEPRYCYPVDYKFAADGGADAADRQHMKSRLVTMWTRLKRK